MKERGAGADLAVTAAQARRNVRDLETVRFTFDDPAAELPKGLEVERLDVVRLEPARRSGLHLGLDALDVGGSHDVADQGSVVDHVLESLADGVVDDALEPLADYRVVAIADRLDEQVAQRFFGEGLAEYVEDLVAQGGALGVELFEEALEDLTLAGVDRDEVPEMADLGLADAVDTTEALLDPVRVPGQVVVDHEVGPLEVHTFPGRVRGDEDRAVLVLHERLLQLAALLPLGAAVNRDDRLGTAEQAPQPLDEIVQGVAMLGEDDQLAAPALCVEHVLLFREEIGELLPLAVRAARPHRSREALEVGEHGDLDLELGDRLRRRRLVDQLVLDRLDLGVG